MSVYHSVDPEQRWDFIVYVINFGVGVVLNKVVLASWLRIAPTLILICYAVSIILTISQYKSVGPAATIFRAFAWNVVLFYVLWRDRSIQDHSQRLHIDVEIARALDTIGIRREEFNQLKSDLDRVRDYLARVDRIKIDETGDLKVSVLKS